MTPNASPRATPVRTPYHATSKVMNETVAPRNASIGANDDWTSNATTSASATADQSGASGVNAGAAVSPGLFAIQNARVRATPSESSLRLRSRAITLARYDEDARDAPERNGGFDESGLVERAFGMHDLRDRADLETGAKRTPGTRNDHVAELEFGIL